MTTVALVGCGEWGSLILRDLVSLGCKVDVVVRSQQARARACAFGARAVVTDLEATRGVDGVVVAAPQKARPALIHQALTLGVPVFTEKPLATARDVAQGLVAAGANRLFVLDKYRWHPGVLAIRELAGDGLGAITSIRTSRLRWQNPRGESDMIWNLLPHDLAIVLELLGALPPPTAAWATAHRSEPTRLVGVLGGDGAPLVISEVAIRVEPRRELLVTFDDGAAALGPSDDSITVWRDGADEPEERSASGELPLLAELRAAVEHLCGGPPPRSSAAEGFAVVDAISALRAAAGVDG